MRNAVLSGVVALILCTAAWPLRAADWPDKPIKIVVPFPPGGATDAAARIYAPRMAKLLGQPVVIENKPGAGGEIGAEQVARATPDGYTLLMGALGSLAIHAAMPKKPAYDLATAYAGVSLAITMPMAVAVSSRVQAKSISELITLAKAEPGRLTIGTGGQGTSQHMASELFQIMSGTRLVHVPYRGSGPAIADLLGGQIDMVIDTLPALMGQADNKRIRILAVTTPERAHSLPTVPTLAEAGVPDYSVATTYALMAPSGTPEAVIRKLSEAMRTSADNPEVQKSAAKLGALAVATTPAQTREVIRGEIEKWGRVVATSLAAEQGEK